MLLNLSQQIEQGDRVKINPNCLGEGRGTVLKIDTLGTNNKVHGK